ncbi:MAG: ATP-grasp domain-containing protein [Pseudomonadales bacterium]|nr:ATP-grasp domain-containing protein [Pseudomonadales bacterium]
MDSNQQSLAVYAPKKILQGANLYCRNSILVAELDKSVSGKAVDQQFLDSALQLINEFRSTAAKTNLDSMPALADSIPANTFAEVLNTLALTLQRWCGLPVSFAQVLKIGEGAQSEHVVFECRLDHLATAAGQIAAEACLHCMNPQLLSKERIQNIITEFERVFISSRTTQIPFIRQAEESSIPWLPLTVDGAILAFGQGAKIKKIHQNYTSSTSLIASRIATDKYTTANMLRAQGIPVPRQLVVTEPGAALEAARKLGFPVVVKPARNDFGTAVFVDVRDEQEVTHAFNEASKHGPVIVEQQIPGEQHRIMVINGKFRSARRQLPAHVIGDGTSSVQALIDKTNETRLANDWQPIPNDDEAKAQLKKQEMKMDSVPSSGQMAKLRSQANLSTGGSMEDLTSQVHPVNIQLAERTAAIVDIDVAGLGFISRDISKPYWEVGAAFCEVNVTPGLILNEEEIILSEWFGDEDKGRVITIVLLDPAPDKNSGAKIAEFLQGKYSKVCLATKKGNVD